MPVQPDNPMRPDPRTQDEKTVSAAMHGNAAGSDKLLIDRVRAREQQAMTEIFDKYARLVYSVTVRVLRDNGQAEDVTQEIFFQLWQSPESFLASKGSLASWLLVVARNRAIDRLRQRRYAEPADEMIVASATNLENEVECNIMMQRVQRFIGDLPADQQQSLQLAYWEGLSHSKIAERTGLPLGTVKTRIRSALTNLRKRLEA